MEAQLTEDQALELYSSDAYLTINKSLLRAYGPDAAIYLSNLVDKYRYFKQRGEAKDGWFFLIQTDQAEETGMTLRRIRSCKKFFMDKGVIEIQRKGIPSKEWYRIQIDNLLKLTNNGNSSSYSKTVIANYDKTVTANYSKTVRAHKENKYKENKLEGVKDTKVSSGSYLNQPKNVQKVIDYWNSLPVTTKHKRSDTKVYKQAAAMIDNLLSGRPLVKTKSGSPTKPLENFIDDFHINTDLLKKQWTVDEIVGLLQQIHDYDLDEKDKRSLPSVFWNNFAKRSQAFSLFLYRADQAHVDKSYYDLANRLASIIDPDADTPTLAVWAKDFENLVSSNGTTEKDVKESLNWYRDHYNDKFTPKADDAQEFCLKFRKIYRAMMRDKQDKVRDIENDARRINSPFKKAQ